MHAGCSNVACAARAMPPSVACYRCTDKDLESGAALLCAWRIALQLIFWTAIAELMVGQRPWEIAIMFSGIYANAATPITIPGIYQGMAVHHLG